MQFSAADQTAIIVAVGEPVTLCDLPIVGDFRIAGRRLEMYDGAVMSSAPNLRVTAADYASADVVYGSPVVARGVNYTVIEIMPEASGMILFTLTVS